MAITNVCSHLLLQVDEAPLLITCCYLVDLCMMREPRYRFTRDHMSRYLEVIQPSEPVEDFDDRNAIYAMSVPCSAQSNIQSTHVLHRDYSTGTNIRT